LFNKGTQARSGKLVIDADEGSITPLILLYFIVIMSSIFVVANIASIYIDRKELINVTEGALSKAAQELDENRYYYSLPQFISPNFSEMVTVPINCRDAGSTFRRELQLFKGDKEIEVVNFQCNGEDLRAYVKQKSKLIFELPLFEINEFTNQVSVSVRSIYLS
jgi:hypothetical protein